MGIFDDFKRLFKIITDNYNGLNKIYNDEGKLLIKFFKKKGQNHGLYKEYYPDGQLKMEMEFSNGVINSIRKEYYPDGELKYKGGGEYMYRNWGRLQSYDSNYNGVCKEYHPNGQLSEEGECNGNEKIGIWKSYFSNGQLYREWLENGYHRWMNNQNKINMKNYFMREFSFSGDLLEEHEYCNETKDLIIKSYLKSGEVNSKIIKHKKIVIENVSWNKNNFQFEKEIDVESLFRKNKKLNKEEILLDLNKKLTFSRSGRECGSRVLDLGPEKFTFFLINNYMFFLSKNNFDFFSGKINGEEYISGDLF
jgi:antitoxin component YwqK of YwqJK toxin-antitoxin module